jgi:hypothetical protein
MALAGTLMTVSMPASWKSVSIGTMSEPAAKLTVGAVTAWALPDPRHKETPRATSASAAESRWRARAAVLRGAFGGVHRRETRITRA